MSNEYDNDFEFVKQYIRKLNFESKNPRNDGWVQSHYTERLNEIISLISKIKQENLKLSSDKIFVFSTDLE